MLPALFREGGGGLLDQLGINFPVIGVQIVLFLLAFWILRRFLFGPAADFTRRRQQELDEALHRIEEQRKEADRLAAEHRDKLAAIEKQAYESLQKAIQEGLAEKARLIAQAGEEARRELETARTEIRRDREEAKLALQAESKRLAVEAASKVLQRHIG